MTHRCDTPSKYSPQFVYGGFRCQCGQRWINLPTGEYGAEWTRVSWRRWFWISYGLEVTTLAFVAPTIAALIILGWIPIIP